MTNLPEDVAVRAATPADLDAIAELVSTCDQSYADWAPPGWNAPDEAEERDRWRRRWGVTGSWTRVAVGRDADIVGVVSWSPARERDGAGDPIPGVGHIGAVYVRPDRWRQGIASDLLDRAEDAMRESGCERAQLWTPEGAPARGFYEAQGWTHDGRRQFFAILDLPLVAYSKQLA
jgi:GNAT superfamily N-acetyltransferase